jgi:uncharacterized protein (DUF2236 family)
LAFETPQRAITTENGNGRAPRELPLPAPGTNGRPARPAGRPGAMPIPAGPHDWGLFGPGSVSWKVHSSPVLLVGGLRALIIQSLNPLAMAGVAQHSDYLKHPLKRLRRTSEYVTTIVYGDTGSAERAAAAVRRVHKRVHGVDPVTGRRYSAEDPETMLWVHCVEVHSFLAAYRAYGGRLNDVEQDAYLAEQVRAAELIGIRDGYVPASRADYRAYFESVRGELCLSESSRNAIELCVAPPMMRELLPYQVPLRIMGAAAVAITPKHLRRIARIERSRAVYAGARAVSRAAGVVLRAPLLREASAGAVGKRTITLPRAAMESAQTLR